MSIIPEIFKIIAIQLKIPVVPAEMRPHIIAQYNKINPDLFLNYTSGQVIPLISRHIIEQLKAERERQKKEIIEKGKNPIRKIIKQVYKEKFDDTHEMLKEIIGAASETPSDRYVSSLINNKEVMDDKESKCNLTVNDFLGINNVETMQLLFNPDSIYEHHYVLLNAANRNFANALPDDNYMTWNYATSLNVQPGFCNSLRPIRDVVGIRMFTPKFAVGVFYNSILYITIEEFKAQAYNRVGFTLGPAVVNELRYHFTFNFEQYSFQTFYVNEIREVDPDPYNDNIFRFRQPITSFETLTLTFTVNYEPMNSIPLDFADSYHLEFICLKSDK